MAKLKGQLLELIGTEPVVIPEDVVVTWPRSPLDALVRAQVKVKLCRVGYANVHSGASRYVARTAGLFFKVGAEEASVVALLHHNEGDARLVVRFQFDAGFADGS